MRGGKKEKQGCTYDNKQYKIYKIVEGVSIHDIVHDIHPSLQCDDLVEGAEGDETSQENFIPELQSCKKKKEKKKKKNLFGEKTVRTQT